jgi:hypothetical protein
MLESIAGFSPLTICLSHRSGHSYKRYDNNRPKKLFTGTNPINRRSQFDIQIWHTMAVVEIADAPMKHLISSFAPALLRRAAKIHAAAKRAAVAGCTMQVNLVGAAPALDLRTLRRRQAEQQGQFTRGDVESMSGLAKIAAATACMAIRADSGGDDSINFTVNIAQGVQKSLVAGADSFGKRFFA